MAQIESLSANDKVRLNGFMDAAFRSFQEIADSRESLKELAKTLAEELDVKPAVLMKAARVAFKASLADEKEQVDNITEILLATGRA